MVPHSFYFKARGKTTLSYTLNSLKAHTTFELSEGDRAAGALGLRLWEGTCQVWDLFGDKVLDRPELCVTVKFRIQEGGGIAGVVFGKTLVLVRSRRGGGSACGNKWLG